MSNFVRYENLEISTATPMGKELLKWERPANYRPENHPYPTTLFKAYKGDDGVIRCMESEPFNSSFTTPELYRLACERVKRFNEQCLKVVHDENEAKGAYAEGWRDSPKEAMDVQWAYEHAISDAAQHRAFEDRNLSEKAKAEVAAIEASTPEVLGEIPEAPIQKKVHWKTAQKQAKEAGAQV